MQTSRSIPLPANRTRSTAATTRTAVSAALLAVLSTMAVTTVPPAARADQAKRLAVTSDGPARFWSGEVRKDGPPIPHVRECRTVHCDKLELKVSLPPFTWLRPGGVQVAIRWNGASEGALGLFVYRGNKLVAKSDAGVGTAQSALIPFAKNGTYFVYVSYGVTFGAVDPDPVIPYEGLAEVEYEPPVRPLRNLMPDLSALPQESVTYDNPGSIFGDTAPPGQSCFQSEIVEQAAVQCLRFDQVMQNVGTGPLEVRFDRKTGEVRDEDVVQRIYRSDRSFTDVPSGQVEFHPVHGHYHFKGFAVSELRTLSDSGAIGATPAAVGDKVSFCIADTDLIAFGRKGDQPLSYPAPNCLDPKEVVGNTEIFFYGMSRGWADRYNWFLPDQMIDTKGLADGRYVLITRVDPENRLREADEGNNCGTVVVQLSALATRQPRAELLGPGPACPAR